MHCASAKQHRIDQVFTGHLGVMKLKLQLSDNLSMRQVGLAHHSTVQANLHV